jgi:hypothetical protein
MNTYPLEDCDECHAEYDRRYALICLCSGAVCPACFSCRCQTGEPWRRAFVRRHVDSSLRDSGRL